MENEQNLGWATAWVIREAREAAGLTQGQLAGFSGLSDSYIALVQMASVLKVTAWELMRRIEEEMERGPRSPLRSPGRPRKKADSKS